MESPVNAQELKEKRATLERAAGDLGFLGFGVAAPDTAEAAERFDDWLARGFHGEMAWLPRQRDKRADLDRVLPGVQSVICLSTPYLTRPRRLEDLNDGRRGDISCYAWNLDYHDLIPPRLKKLEAVLADLFPGCRSKSYVDTGPVPEKELARQAGLGWIGKHTNLLTLGAGSWYFLSVILTDAPLAPDAPAEDQCGPCRACLDICPTGALVAPYLLDARRCISYLTIELRGPIPVEFRRALGNRIYGCDDCQIVCPWNENPVMTEEPAFAERVGTKDLIELMRLDEAGFRERFRKSPVKRIKRRGLLRNVAVALGNSGDPSAVPVLKQALEDPEPLIRAHAVWALGELLGGKRAGGMIGEVLKNEKNDWVKKEMVLLEA